MDQKQKLTVDGKEVPPREMWRYTLRWYLGNGGCVPTLYIDGKRITCAWSLTATFDVPADPSGGNANTA